MLVPLFLTVLDLPLFNRSLLDTYWAVWLPAGANAFNVLLVNGSWTTCRASSVRLPTIRETVELDVFLAALLISMALPVAIFLVFQRLFLRDAGLGGAVKG